MPLSENEIKNLLSLDNSRLKEIINEISDTVGGSRRKTDAITANLDELKKKLASMDPEEINRLINKAGKDRSEQILNNLKNR